jgi:nicotine blue oxidoreductase
VKPAGLVLAAGAGRRMGRPKALVWYEGEQLADRAVRLLREGGCDPVVLVLGAAHEQVQVPVGCQVVLAHDWASGQAASLRAGLHALAAGEATAAVVVLVDQPLLGPEAVRRVAAAWREGATAAQATYGGRPGHPVLLGRSVWPAVAEAAEGDVGARAWLRAHAESVRHVPCDGTGTPDDLDTRQDVAAAMVRDLSSG